jgi:hypothetical protein
VRYFLASFCTIFTFGDDDEVRPESGMSEVGGARVQSCVQDDLGPPDMLLGRFAILDQGPQALADGGRDSKGYSSAHAPDSHAPQQSGIPRGIQVSDFFH